MAATNEDFDILDEFLDRRLYDHPQNNQQQLQQQQLQQHQLQDNNGQRTLPQQQQQQQHLNPHQLHQQVSNPHFNEMNIKDEEIFRNFLTDDLNKNDLMYFNGDITQQHQFDSTNIGQPLNLDNNGNTMGNISNMANSTSPADLSMESNGNNYSHIQQHAATPNSIDLQSPESISGKQEIFTTPNSSINVDRLNPIGVFNSPFDSSYETSREILSQLKFGKETPTQFENELPKKFLDVDANSLPYKMNIKNLPSYSRVETQIKLDLSISPPPPQFLVHLPSDTIAKQKLCLKSELTDQVKENMLFLDTYVLTATTDKSCNICPRCVKREQKRASRRKSGVSDNLNWGTNTSKRAVIFNCKEVISFPPAVQNTNSKDLDISARIVCYCRHHQETKGFKLLFVLTDHKGNILAKHVSTSIMIMDRKKNADDTTNSANEASNSVTTANNSNNNSDTNLSNMRINGQPLSPTSIEEDSSEPHTTDSRIFKRKRTWSPELSDGFSIAPSRKPSYTNGTSVNSISGMKRDPVSPSMSISSHHPGSVASSTMPGNATNSTLPSIQRVIPSQGPLRGGVEVTLLGSNFRQGLTVKFGINKALSTHCWSDTTIVTYLPPASQPGQVIVSFEENDQEASSPGNKNIDNINTAIFTYLDDSDRQLIELALQIVGLKMNGKLEDARNIARKIIGSDGNNNGGASEGNGSTTESINGGNATFNSLQSCTDEELVLKVINLLPNNPNWSLCTQEGQTLLHLSCLKGYYKLVSSLLRKGARVDSRDVNGFTPLHFASLAGDRNSIELLINCKANLSIRSNNGSTAEDVADSNVLDIFKHYDSSSMQRRVSNSSISSSIFSIESEDELIFHSGAHVSRLVNDHLTDQSLESDEYDSESIEAGDEESEINSDYSGDDADFEDDEDDYSFENNHSQVTTNQAQQLPSTSDSTVTSADVSLWNKVRNVFNNSSDVEDLPKYDDLYPSSSKHFTIPKLRFSNFQSTSQSTTETTTNNSSDESEDIFIKFFHQRKNVQNDKMLLFFWLPLLILIISFFILINSGWTFSWNDNFQEFVRSGLGKVMLGNERVKVAFNKHLSQMNEAVTSVINVNN